jgi:ornithine carbamoyltransferase
VLSVEGSQIARGEPLKDTARVLAGYCDAIVMRTFGHDRIEEMASYAEVPVINALTDLLHPCQVLADCFTLTQRFGELKGKKVAWIGDGNNMANSWINAAAILDFELMLACPEGFEPDRDILDAALKDGAKVAVVRDPNEAAKGSVAVNTDVWASMGREEEAGIRKKAFVRYKVDDALMDAAGPDAVFMHCLPAHRGEEVTEEVLEGWRSIVWEQAQNRQYIQEAVLDFLLRE